MRLLVHDDSKYFDIFVLVTGSFATGRLLLYAVVQVGWLLALVHLSAALALGVLAGCRIGR